MPTVLHVAQAGDYGVAKYLLDLVTVQVEAGWCVVVAGTPQNWSRPHVIAAGATWHDWVASRDPGPSLVSEVRSLRAILRSTAPDVVHLHSSKAGLAGRIALRGRTPTMFQPHAWSFYAVQGVRRRAAVAWERFASRWTDATLCVSHAERVAGDEAGIRGEWRVVPTAVDAQRFAPGDRGAARAELGLGSGPIAICVARLAVSQKGQDVLLRAWPQVASSVPDATLLLLGDGPDRTLLEGMAPPSVQLVGARDDIERWYQASNVVVQPSRYEGLSMTILEALASARSIVTTDAVGMRESVGDAGAVVPIDDPDAVAAALIERLGDLERADREGARGRQRVVERFDPGRWGEAMLAATLDVAGGPPAA